MPRLPPCPSKLDKLLVDIMREQARVVTIVNRMKAIFGYHQRISQDSYSVLAKWKECVDRIMIMRRTERMGQGAREDDSTIWSLVALLCGVLRKARTLLWIVSVEGGDKRS